MHVDTRIRLIIQSGQHILLTEAHKPDGTPFYFLPGGGLEHGETVAQCAIRELGEECSIAPALIHNVSLRAVYEHSYPYGDSLWHEIQLICICDIDGLDAAIPVISAEPKISFHWVRFDDLPDVNLLPADMRQLLPQWLADPIEPARIFSSGMLA